MVEHVLPEEALAGVGAVGHAVEPLQVLDLAHHRALDRERIDLRQHPLLAVLGIRVGGEPPRYPSGAARRAHVSQHLVHVGHLAGVVAGAAHVPQPQVIGLPLVIPTELEEQQLQARRRYAEIVLHLGHQHRAGHEPHLRQLLLRHLLRRVPRRDVPDLVSQHRDQLGLGVEVGHDPAGDVDVPAGQRERVDQGIVHHPESPGQIGPLRDAHQVVAQVGYVALDRRVGVDAKGRRHLRIGLPPHGNLLALADQHELPLSGGRVHGARREARGGERQE